MCIPNIQNQGLGIHVDEFQAPDEYDHQQYITFEYNIRTIYNIRKFEHISTYFIYFQLIYYNFNHIHPMDRLQQVSHLHQVAHLHPSVQHYSTKIKFVSTYFNISQHI